MTICQISQCKYSFFSNTANKITQENTPLSFFLSKTPSFYTILPQIITPRPLSYLAYCRITTVDSTKQSENKLFEITAEINY